MTKPTSTFSIDKEQAQILLMNISDVTFGSPSANQKNRTNTSIQGVFKHNRNAHIKTIGQWVSLSQTKKGNLVNMGRKSLAEIEEALSDIGLKQQYISNTDYKNAATSGPEALSTFIKDHTSRSDMSLEFTNNAEFQRAVDACLDAADKLNKHLGRDLGEAIKGVIERHMKNG